MTCPISRPGLLVLMFLAFAVAGSRGSAEAQEAKTRTQLMSKDDPWVGQRVVLVIELLVPGFFSGTPRFDLPNIPEALFVPPDGSPVLRSEQIEGVSFTVQRHEFFIFSHRAVDYHIPAFMVRLKFKHAPTDQETVSETVLTTPVAFTAHFTPGAENLIGLLSARQLQVTEKWQPAPGKAKAGDAFTRIIRFAAPEIPAMAFPPFPAPQIDGLSIYRKDPEILDQSERGKLRGQRLDSITHVCQRAGHFVIPAVRLTWWDLDSKRLRTIDFPVRELEVAPNPGFPSSMLPPEQPGRSANRFW
jgi:hypothetical protein